MENSSWPTVGWEKNTTTEYDNSATSVGFHAWKIAFKIIMIFTATLGIIGNLFVLIIFILFIKIMEKVFDAVLKYLDIKLTLSKAETF